MTSIGTEHHGLAFGTAVAKGNAIVAKDPPASMKDLALGLPKRAWQAIYGGKVISVALLPASAFVLPEEASH